MDVVDINISRGQKAIIDREDSQLVSQFKWYAMWKPQTLSYVAITCKGLLMHRVIMHAKHGEQVDHINHDSLDNRKSNLRLVTNGQNQMNRRKLCHSRRTWSQMKGVSFNRRRGKWIAYINLDKKRICLGAHDTQESAARAYDEAANRLHGEFALTNSSLGLLGR